MVIQQRLRFSGRFSPQCFDAVGWCNRKGTGLQNLLQLSTNFILEDTGKVGVTPEKNPVKQNLKKLHIAYRICETI